MRLNVATTQVPPPIQLGNRTLEIDESTKFPSITIYNKLFWDCHIITVVGTSSHKFYMLHMLCPPDTFLQHSRPAQTIFCLPHLIIIPQTYTIKKA